MFPLNSVFFLLHTHPPPTPSLLTVWLLLGVFFQGVGTQEREGGSTGNPFLMMILSKGVFHVFVHLTSRSFFTTAWLPQPWSEPNKHACSSQLCVVRAGCVACDSVCNAL